ncbi:MAG: DUF2589 domain-containing protein [Paludibacteraceae bacterium]|nr:DUF2589 domain-containing protein [Paludibacteraceae bacterium]
MEDEIGFGLVDALRDALESTIEADSASATRCCDIIREYAYGYPSGNDNGKFGKLNTGMSNSLTMAKFTMKSADGTLQEVQIPQITMMPLPLLHVKEASFEFDMNMELAENKSVELQKEEVQKAEEVKTSPTGRRVTVGRRSNANGKAAFIIGISRPSSQSSQNAQANEKSITETSNSSSSTTHIKATIKMEQADLPAGIKTLLQAAANSLTINDKK